MTIEPGTLLGDRYRVVRVLGRGGMGLVAEARNVITDKRVAVKWLHPDVARDPEMSQRLLREATAASRIRHPNVVDVYDVIRDGAAIILVMELLEGMPLRGLLDRRPSTSELLAVLLPAMRGVSEAHRQGVIHRDIHPANIFLANESGVVTPKVLDFGISKLGAEEQREGPGLTRSGVTMGTPLYMSYEQLISARDVDVRTDVYSFGVVLYEGLTGQLPYDGETFAAIAMQIMNGTPVPPRELCPALPRELERVVQRAMARNRQDRIATLEELASALLPFAAGAVLPAPVEARAQNIESGPAAANAHDETVSLPAEERASTGGGRRIDTQGRTSTPFAQSAPPRALIDPARTRQKRALIWGMLAGASVAVIGAATVLHGSRKPPPPSAKPALSAPALPEVPAAAVASTLPVVPASASALVVPDAGAVEARGTVRKLETALPPVARPPQRALRPVVAPVPPPDESAPHFRAGRARREDF